MLESFAHTERVVRALEHRWLVSSDYPQSKEVPSRRQKR